MPWGEARPRAALPHGATPLTSPRVAEPVAGFGWLLLVMGAAQLEPQQRWLQRLYVVAFLAVLFCAEVPWAGLLLDVSRAGS